MNCEELAAEYDSFALGASDGEELAALREHLAADCPICVPGVRNALGFVASLSAAVDQVEPPARLRGKILAMVGTPAPARAVWKLWAAGFAIAFGILAFFTIRNGRELERSGEALAFLRAGDVKQFAVQQPDARADVFVSRSRGVLLVASGFKRAPAGRIYEMWLIAKNAQPAPAGLFEPQRDGSVLHISKGLDQPLAAVAVTEEPESGSALPTTKPFLVATP